MKKGEQYNEKFPFLLLKVEAIFQAKRDIDREGFFPYFELIFFNITHE